MRKVTTQLSRAKLFTSVRHRTNDWTRRVQYPTHRRGTKFVNGHFLSAERGHMAREMPDLPPIAFFGKGI